MELEGKTIVITGGASGIGKALAERAHADGATHVVVVDRDEAGAGLIDHALHNKVLDGVGGGRGLCNCLARSGAGVVATSGGIQNGPPRIRSRSESLGRA